MLKNKWLSVLICVIIIPILLLLSSCTSSSSEDFISDSVNKLLNNDNYLKNKRIIFFDLVVMETKTTNKNSIALTEAMYNKLHEKIKNAGGTLLDRELMSKKLIDMNFDHKDLFGSEKRQKLTTQLDIDLIIVGNITRGSDMLYMFIAELNPYKITSKIGIELHKDYIIEKPDKIYHINVETKAVPVLVVIGMIIYMLYSFFGSNHPNIYYILAMILFNTLFVYLTSGIKDVEGMVYGSIGNQMWISAFIFIAFLINYSFEMVRIDDSDSLVNVFKHPFRAVIITVFTIGLFTITRIYIMPELNIYFEYHLF